MEMKMQQQNIIQLDRNSIEFPRRANQKKVKYARTSGCTQGEKWKRLGAVPGPITGQRNEKLKNKIENKIK